MVPGWPWNQVGLRHLNIQPPLPVDRRLCDRSSIGQEVENVGLVSSLYIPRQPYEVPNYGILFCQKIWVFNSPPPLSPCFFSYSTNGRRQTTDAILSKRITNRVLSLSSLYSPKTILRLFPPTPQMSTDDEGPSKLLELQKPVSQHNKALQTIENSTTPFQIKPCQFQRI